LITYLSEDSLDDMLNWSRQEVVAFSLEGEPKRHLDGPRPS
jgi:hypothetical protein